MFRKKMVLVFLLGSLLAVAAFSLTYPEAKEAFRVANSEHDVEGMKALVEQLRSMQQVNPTYKALHVNAITELANWGITDEKEREALYEEAVEIGKEAVELFPNDAYSNYVTGAAIGRLAQFKGIVKSLFMLGDFDKYVEKAKELDPNNFLPCMALGMRYRDVPWPMSNFKKSEENFLMAIQLEPGYQNAYYELAMLYKTDKKKTDLAIEYFEKTLATPPHPDWVAQAEEAYAKSRLELEELR
ncbi:MAG TPA: hypothetical protein P5560_09835 [Thermotogota bacterium]|nr:hypothetical protein [Thermotogota bacterium]HRW93234.1 hypothetical protein [Thermotogota bacterium]